MAVFAGSAYVDPVRAGSLLTLQGAGAYDAAVHCASVSAARRILQQRASGDSPTFASGGLRGGAGGFDMLSPATPRDPRLAVRGGTAGAGASSSAGGAVMLPPDAAASSPADSSPGAASSTSDAGPGKSRRLAGFGRKIRSALCDLLTIKQ